MSSSETELGEAQFDLIGTGSALSQVVAFTAVGAIVLESLPYGLVVGLMSGGGAYLFMPWFLRLSAAQENGAEERPLGETIEQVPGRPRRHLFGLGLEIGAIAMLVIGFALDDTSLVAGTAGGLAVAILVYLVVSVGLDRFVLADG
jgi:hypothetical protein